jgi:streptogramin lyase
VPSAFAYALGITAGPDGNVWFAETNTEKLGKLVP